MYARQVCVFCCYDWLMVDDRALRFRQEYRAPVSRPLAPTPSPLDALGRNYLRGSEQQVRRQADEGRGVLNFLNPVPSVTSAVAEGRAPRFSDVALDAGLLAAGLIPFGGPAIRAGGQAARPALETGEAIAARRDAIDRLLNKEGPEAINDYLQRPLTAYQSTQNPDLLRRFFAETSERIPAGTQMYRAPSAGQVSPRLGSQSVPLPREIGADFLPNRVQSAAGSGDLQALGTLVRGIDRMDTGGGQRFAPGMMAIEAMEDLPGIYDLNQFLSRFDNPNFSRSSFGIENVLGPQVRYTVRDFVSDAGSGFPTWYLNAYAR
jgi:hypothetical protein